MFKGRKLRVSGPINFSNTLICLQNVCKLPRRKRKWAVIIAYLQDLKNSLQEPPVFVYFSFLGEVAYLQWHGNKVIAAVTHHRSNLSIRLWSNKYTNNSTHKGSFGIPSKYLRTHHYLPTSLKHVLPVEQQTGSFRQPKQEQGISILFQSTYAPSLVLVSPPSFFCGLCSGT